MVAEKVIEGPQIGIPDVIEFEDLSSNIIVAGNKRNDYISPLSDRIMRTDTKDLKKLQTSGSIPNM